MSKKQKLVPVQFMVAPIERVRIRAQAKRRGCKSAKEYLKGLVAADIAAGK